MQNCEFFFDKFFTHQDITTVFFFILILFVQVFLYFEFKGLSERIIALIISVGALMNLVDFSVDGCVTDPFDFFGLFHFNIPDLMITLGSLTLFVIYLIKNTNAEN